MLPGTQPEELQFCRRMLLCAPPLGEDSPRAQHKRASLQGPRRASVNEALAATAGASAAAPAAAFAIRWATRHVAGVCGHPEKGGRSGQLAAASSAEATAPPSSSAGWLSPRAVRIPQAVVQRTLHANVGNM